jgi:hypothetical protein
MQRHSAFLSRRVLLAGLGAGAVGAVAAASPVLSLRLSGPASASGAGRPASWWDRTFLSLQSAGLAEWSGVVGEAFTLETLNGSHMLRIVAVTAFPRSGHRPTALARSQAFSVVFESIAGPPLPATDRVYQLVHRSYPPLPIYMAAPFKTGQKSRLIAVFN